MITKLFDKFHLRMKNVEEQEILSNICFLMYITFSGMDRHLVKNV
jgi:hypothetical protein